MAENSKQMQTPSVASGQYKDLGEMMRALMALPGATYIPIKPEAFIPSEGYEITMNGAGITNAKSKTPILGTYGLATCMGIAIQNVNHSMGGYLHLSVAEKDPQHINEHGKQTLIHLLSALRQDPSDRLEVRITGPMGTSGFEDTFIKDVLSILNAQPNLHILSADFKGKGYPRNVGIDTRHWDQGLLKGINSSGLSLGEIIQDPVRLAAYRKGAEHVVDITAMPSAQDYDARGIFDARGKSFTDLAAPNTLDPQTLRHAKTKRSWEVK